MFELVGIIQKWFWRILAVSLLATVGSVVFSLFLKDEFKSVAKIMPMNPNFLDKNAVFGEGGTRPTYLFGSKDDIDRLISLASSEETNAYLIDKYDLYNRYLIDPNKKNAAFNLRKRLSKNMKAQKSASGHLDIIVYDKEPQFAAEMANDVANKIDQANKRILLEKKLQIRDLLAAETASKQREMNSLVDSIRNVQSRSAGDTLEVFFLSEVLEGVIEDYNALYKSYKEQESLVEMDFSSIYFIEKAQPAVRKDKPVRSLIVLGTFALSFFLLTLWAIFSEKYQSYKKVYD